MPFLDEHGQSLGEVPLFVTPATLERWLVCATIAERITQQASGHPEHTLFARHLFDLPIPLGDVGEGLDEGERVVIEEARISRHLLSQLARRRRRTRIGRFADEFGRLRMPKPPQSPGPVFTEEQIREAGLDQPPEKGPAAKRLLGDAHDTTALYGQDVSATGVQRVLYPAEQEREHDSIIAEFKRDKTPPGTRPHAVYMAGGSGSGKTTLLRHNPELVPPPEHTIHIDSDEIKKRMNVYRELHAAGDHYAAVAVHRESGDIAARLLMEAMDEGYHVVIDGTGDSEPGDFTAALEVARERNYTVDVLYVTVPTNQAISWAIRRAEEDDGRYVPVSTIREKHAKVSRSFVDEVLKLDWLNSVEIIDQGEHIATWENGRLKPLNQEKLAAFIAKMHELDG